MSVITFFTFTNLANTISSSFAWELNALLFEQQESIHCFIKEIITFTSWPYIHNQLQLMTELDFCFFNSNL